MTRRHDPYCDRSAALGEGFPDLIGGVIGLAIGLTRGSVLAARRVAEDAIWMDSGRPTTERTVAVAASPSTVSSSLTAARAPRRVPVVVRMSKAAQNQAKGGGRSRPAKPGTGRASRAGAGAAAAAEGATGSRTRRPRRAGRRDHRQEPRPRRGRPQPRDHRTDSRREQSLRERSSTDSRRRRSGAAPRSEYAQVRRAADR